MRHYNRERSGLGRELRDEVRAAVDRIESFPDAHQRLSPHTRRALLHRFPYGVIYQVRPDEILIVAVAHLHREPGYWHSRVSTP